MNVPFFNPQREFAGIKNEIDAAINGVISSGEFILGEQVSKFEGEWATYLGSKFAIGVASGTDALIIALKALGVGPGDEVIVPTFTFTASALAVTAIGGTPVFVDVKDETHNIDPLKIEEKITKKTKAIMPVHLHGNPADMDEIVKIAKKYKLYVIEDAAQAHGAKYKNKKAGTIGDIGCFSFYPTKNLGAYGDGGAIVTDSEKLADKVRLLRNYGQKKRYFSETYGVNSRLDEIQAAILRIKLRKLDEWNSKRVKNALIYKKHLENTSFKFPIQALDSRNVFHHFVIRTKNRDSVLKKLTDNNIGALIHYPVPLHLQGVYASAGYKRGDFPASEKITDEIISLPMYQSLSENEIIFIANCLKKT